MQLSDQVFAIKLAICDDTGEKSYSVATIAAIPIEILKNLPSAGTKVLTNCYKIDADGCTGEVYLKTIGLHLFKGDTNQAACRVLQDFCKGKFGWIDLERPPPRRKDLHW